MNFPELLEATSESVPNGFFWVGVMKLFQEANQPVCPEDFDFQFEGDSSKASALVAWGIIRSNNNVGKQSILLHNPLDKPQYPYCEDPE